MELTQEQLTEFSNAVTALKEARENHVKEMKKFGDDLGETKEKFAKVSTDISDLNTKFQERMDALETKLNKPTNGAETNEPPLERKAFDHFFRMGEDRTREMHPEYMKALSLESDTAAHYLVVPSYMPGIIRRIQEVDPIRQLATVQQTSTDSLIYAYDSADFSMSWTADTGSRSESTGQTFGQKVIPVHEGYVLLKLSQGLLEDNAFNVENYLTEKAAERIAYGQGQAFVSGNGVGKPIGLLTDGDVGHIASGHASTLPDDAGSKAMVDVTTSIKAEYANNATWLFSRSTLAVLLKMRDGFGRWLWEPNHAAGAPATILGYPYRESTTMPTIAAGADSLLFGDIRRAYVIAERIGISLLRDPYTNKGTGLVDFQFRSRVGGKVVLPEAIYKLRIEAS